MQDIADSGVGPKAWTQRRVYFRFRLVYPEVQKQEEAHKVKKRKLWGMDMREVSECEPDADSEEELDDESEEDDQDTSDVAKERTWTAAQDQQLVREVIDAQTGFWDQVAKSLNRNGGRHFEAEDCVRRFRKL